MAGFRKGRYAWLVVLGLLGIGTRAAAQSTAQTQTLAARPSHAAQLKGALRSVVAAQTRYRATRGRLRADDRPASDPAGAGGLSRDPRRRPVRLPGSGAAHGAARAQLRHLRRPARGQRGAAHGRRSGDGGRGRSAALRSHAVTRAKPRWTAGAARVGAAALSGGAALASILSYTSSAGIPMPGAAAVAAHARAHGHSRRRGRHRRGDRRHHSARRGGDRLQRHGADGHRPRVDDRGSLRRSRHARRAPSRPRGRALPPSSCASARWRRAPGSWCTRCRPRSRWTTRS